MNEGILLNAIVTLTGGAAYLALVPRLLRRERSPTLVSQIAFIYLVGAHLALAGLRQLVAFAAQQPREMLPAPLQALDLHSVDLALFILVTTVGASTAVAISHLVLVARGLPRLAAGVTVGLGALALVGLVVLATGEIAGPEVTAWGSEWAVLDARVNYLLTIAFGLPALVSVVALLRNPLLETPNASMFGWGALAYYLAAIPDAIGLQGIAFVGARFIATSSSLLMWEATREPVEVLLPEQGYSASDP